MNKGARLSLTQLTSKTSFTSGLFRSQTLLLIMKVIYSWRKPLCPLPNKSTFSEQKEKPASPSCIIFVLHLTCYFHAREWRYPNAPTWLGAPRKHYRSHWVSICNITQVTFSWSNDHLERSAFHLNLLKLESISPARFTRRKTQPLETKRPWGNSQVAALQTPCRNLKPPP